MGFQRAFLHEKSVWGTHSHPEKENKQALLPSNHLEAR